MTNQNSSGETSLIQSMNKRMEVLNDFLNSKGLVDLELELDDITTYLNLSYSEIQSLDVAMCEEIVYLFRQHSYSIKRLLNLESARLQHVTNKQNQLLAEVWDNHKDCFAGKDVKIEYLSRLYPTIKEAVEIVQYTKQRVQSLQDLDQHLSWLAKAIDSIRYNKSRNA